MLEDGAWFSDGLFEFASIHLRAAERNLQLAGKEIYNYWKWKLQ